MLAPVLRDNSPIFMRDRLLPSRLPPAYTLPLMSGSSGARTNSVAFVNRSRAAGEKLGIHLFRIRVRHTRQIIRHEPLPLPAAFVLLVALVPVRRDDQLAGLVLLEAAPQPADHDLASLVQPL